MPETTEGGWAARGEAALDAVSYQARGPRVNSRLYKAIRVAAQ